MREPSKGDIYDLTSLCSTWKGAEKLIFRIVVELSELQTQSLVTRLDAVTSGDSSEYIVTWCLAECRMPEADEELRKQG